MKRFLPFYLSIILFSTPGFSQNALDFDGLDDRVDCGNDVSLQITGTSITLEAWINAGAWKSQVWQGCVINKEQNGFSSDFGYMLRVGNGGRINFNLGDGSWNELTTDTLMSLNTWHHIAGSYDGSMMRIYLDGMLVDSMSAILTIGNSIQNLIIGDYTGLSRNFDGLIDEVKIWNVTRTGMEINADMNTEICGSPTGLVAYYRFNQGVANGNNSGITSLTDKSGNGNDGVLSSFSLNGPSSNWVSGQSLISFDTYDTIAVSDCESYTAPSGTQTWYSSGTYTDIIPNSIGCDSVISINLTILSTSSNQNLSGCSPYLSPSGSQIWTSSGTYTDTLTNSVGCDSILTVNLTILNASSSQNITGCSPYLSPSGNQVWTSSGTYMDTLTNSSGCDSVLTITLTILDVDTSITISGTTLIANASNATYQWFECGSNILLDTFQFYTPSMSGNYWVIVGQSGCFDTSRCVPVTIVGLPGSNSLGSEIRIAPNPASSHFRILEGPKTEGFDVFIYDQAGKKLAQWPGKPAGNYRLSQKLKPGMYLLFIQGSSEVSRIPLVLKR